MLSSLFTEGLVLPYHCLPLLEFLVGLLQVIVSVLVPKSQARAFYGSVDSDEDFQVALDINPLFMEHVRTRGSAVRDILVPANCLLVF